MQNQSHIINHLVRINSGRCHLSGITIKNKRINLVAVVLLCALLFRATSKAGEIWIEPWDINIPVI